MRIFYFRYSAKIVEIDESDNTVLIHFDGWNQRYDEWVEMSSENLRPATRHSERKDKSKTHVGTVSVSLWVCIALRLS